MFHLFSYLTQMLFSNYPNKSLYGGIIWWLPLLLLGEKYSIVSCKGNQALLITRGSMVVFGLYNYLTTELLAQIIAYAEKTGAKEIRGPIHFHSMFAHQIPIKAGEIIDERDREILPNELKEIEKAGFEVAAHYSTLYRKDTRVVGEATLLKANQLEKSGNYLAPIKKSLFNLNSIKKILSITNNAFKDFPSYTHVPLWKFIILSLAQKRSTTLVGIFQNEQIVGYYTYYTTKKGLHLKTIAIDPEYQGNGLTNLVINHTHTGDPVWYDTVYEDGKINDMNKQGIIKGTCYAQFKQDL